MIQITRVASPCATPARLQYMCPSLPRAGPWRRPLLVRAAKGGEDGKDDVMAGALKAAGSLVDKATDLVPESVPRPTAKAGVTIAGVMLVFWLLQKIISGVLTLALFAGVGYYFLTKQSDSDEVVDVTPSKKGKGSDDLDDPLSEARRIMDKYK